MNIKEIMDTVAENIDFPHPLSAYCDDEGNPINDPPAAALLIMKAVRDAIRPDTHDDMFALTDAVAGELASALDAIDRCAANLERLRALTAKDSPKHVDQKLAGAMKAARRTKH